MDNNALYDDMIKYRTNAANLIASRNLGLLMLKLGSK